MFDPISWAVSFGLTRATSKLLGAFDDEGLSKGLQEVVQAWALRLPEQYADLHPDALCATIFSQPSGVEQCGSSSRHMLRASIARQEIPSRQCWCDALVERWLEVRTSLGDDAQRFFAEEPEAVAPLLDELAECLHRTCTSDASLFRASAYRLLEDVSSQLKLDHRAQRPRKAVSEEFKFSEVELAGIVESLRLCVPPRRFEELKLKLLREHLLVISGPPGVGKSLLGWKLCIELESEGIADWVRFPPQGSLEELRDMRRSVVFLDDPFGGVRFASMRQPLEGQDAHLLNMVRTGNYVVIATRSNVLRRAREELKYGERDWFLQAICELDPTDYTVSERRQMLSRHMNVANVSQEAGQFVAMHELLILSTLVFPQNYKNLPIIVGDKANRDLGINAVLRMADNTHEILARVVREFFHHDKDVFYFLVVLALVFGQNRHDFSAAHAACIRALRKKERCAVPVPTPDDLELLTEKAMPWVRFNEVIRYEHNGYYYGVISEMGKHFLGDTLVCVETLVIDKSRRIRDACLESFIDVCIANSAGCLPVVAEWIRTDWQRDGSAAIVLAGCASGQPGASLPFLTELLTSENHLVASDARKAISAALGSCPQAVLPTMVDLVSGQSKVRLLAVDAICAASFRPSGEIWAVIRSLAQSGEWEVRRRVALGVGTCDLADPDIDELLEALSKDGHWMVRAAAEAALKRRGVARENEGSFWQLERS